MKSGIYLIKNIVNNKVYVGSAVNIAKRWREHKRILKKGKHHCPHLQLAWDKYGEQSFTFEIIEIVSNTEHLLAYEQVYLDYYRPHEREKGYNVCKVAGSSFGIKRSEESKRKMSEAGRNMSKEKRRKIAESSKGRIVSEETRQKISEAHKGKIVSEETRKKMSEAKKNISEETRRKIGEASKGRNVGRKHTEEEKQKISKANKGKIVSEETKNKIREANRGKTNKRDLKNCKFYSFIEKKKKYIVRIFKNHIGYYNTEEEAKQAVAENIEKFKTQQIVSQ